MSTRCMLFVRVNPADTGKELSYDPANMTAGVTFEDNEKLKNWSEEEPVLLDKPYVSIYCHADGYPSGTGDVLTAFFNDYEKALNLMGAGSVCYIDKKSESFMDEHAKTWDAITITDPLFIEYVYLFENGLWHVRKTGDDYLTKRNPAIYKTDDFTPLAEYRKMYPDD